MPTVAALWRKSQMFHESSSKGLIRKKRNAPLPHQQPSQAPLKSVSSSFAQLFAGKAGSRSLEFCSFCHLFSIMQNTESISQHPTSEAQGGNSQIDGDFWGELEPLEDYWDEPMVLDNNEVAEMTTTAPPELSNSQHAAIPNPARKMANWLEMHDPENEADLSLLDLQELFDLGVKVLDKRNTESHSASNVDHGPTGSRYAAQALDPGDAVLFSSMDTEGRSWSAWLPDPEPEHQSNDDHKGRDAETVEMCEARWTEGLLMTFLALVNSPIAYENWLDTAACPKTESDPRVINERCEDFFRLALREDDHPALVSGAGDVQYSQVKIHKTHSELQLQQELRSKTYKPHQTAEHASSSGAQSWWDGADPDLNPPQMIVVDRLIAPSAVTCQPAMWLFPREVEGLARGIHSSWLARKDMVSSPQIAQVIHETMGKIKELRSDKYSHELTRRDPYSTMLDMPKREDIPWPSGMSLKIRPHLDWTPECNTVFEMPKAWSVLYERLKPRYYSWLATPPSEMPEGFPSVTSERHVDVPRSSTEDLGTGCVGDASSAAEISR